MRKLSRFGAAALALALSVTFLTPVQAQAAKNETPAELQKKGALADEDELIDKNWTRVEVEGTTEAEVIEKLEKAALEKGFISTTRPADTVSWDIHVINGTLYYSNTYFYFNSNPSAVWDDADENIVGYKGYFEGCTFYNTQTKKSSSYKNEVYNNYTADEAKFNSFQSAIMVKKGEITYLRVALSGGDTEISNVKSSKKKIAKVSVYKKMSSDTTTNKDNVQIRPEKDPSTGKTTYTVYYCTTVGAKVVVGTFDDRDKAEEAAKGAEMTASSAVRYIKIVGNKTGKSKLTFNIKNKNGNVSKVSTTINVVDDTSIYKTLSFGGQSLLEKDLDKKSFYAIPDNYFYTTKAKGKLVAKANKNFVIKKIEKGVLYTENDTRGLDDTIYDEDGDPVGKYSDTYSAYSYSGKKTTHKVDLNGDGDFDDTINGVYEDRVSYKWSKIKSGKTLKLSTVGESYGSSSSYTYKYEYYKNRKGENRSVSNVEKDRNFDATTAIRITYFNKITKQYGTDTFYITRSVSK
ncbi:hypothetical protein [Butyrivibrio sp. MB2005]|uniref:hypothetical protein n=1 Tax=Butyrivibrio sp. MB2005 TaxID=1280678 RepID=UPI0003F62ADF|nr:hypothetical protein [Butyrivibrio sp. MB2005]